jgi:hypothetical protein
MYNWEGRTKQQYFKFIPKIESYVVVSIYRDEYLSTLRRFIFAGISACVIGGFAFFVMTIILANTITKPLKVLISPIHAKGDLMVNPNINQKDN